ncbi:FHA domain-containing protein [Longibacter sp.]|uniref:FHA domain-containing protein n=1 Tax=Longibacter sp. TaxID=2045415 RepID=UPI003EBA41AE
MTHSTNTSSEAVSVPVHVRGDSLKEAFSFTGAFTIGRDASCDVTIDSGLVSRTHAKVVVDGAAWRIHDCDSTNGLYIGGTRQTQALIEDGTVVRFGIDGPALTFGLQDQRGESRRGASASSMSPRETAPSSSGEGAEASAPNPSSTPGHDDPNQRDGAASNAGAERPSNGAVPGMPSSPGAERPSREQSVPDAVPSDPGPMKRSVTAYYDYYFAEDGNDETGGAHTRLLRQAYQRARHSERRQFLYVVVGVLVICLSLAVVALWQYQQRERLEDLAMEVSEGIQRQNLALAQLRRTVEDNPPVEGTIAEIEQERRHLENVYQGYVEELGLRRDLTAEEQIIHRVARTFGESEFSMPAGFVREVRETIHGYWLGPGKPRFRQAIERAQSNGYVQPIVREMMRRGIPPEFFYLALQESDFKTDAVGPPTNWGIAKGMWQFIPTTARAFGLDTGNRVNLRAVDPADERHDFQKSTQAAARYLQLIYTTEAQASGLLVIASYNWGEHRVNSKLNRMDGYGIPDAALEGIEETPDERNYWKFLTTYRSRMPKETRDYVLRVFSAAVIGQAPRHFGFDFDNPLTEAIDAAADVSYAPPVAREDDSP